MKLAHLSCSIAIILFGYTIPFFAISDEAVDLEAIVVTATRTENSVENVPATVEVFTSTEIKEMGATTVRDVLSKGANIQLSAQRGGVNIRGMGWDYTVLLVNGRKAGGLENVKDFQSLLTSTLNVNSIERIEVLRGQAGSMYGANAIGGVINIITKESIMEETSVSISHGNMDSILSLTHDMGQKGNWSGIFNLNYNKFNPEREKSTSGDNSWSETKDGYVGNINANIGYDLGNQQKINLEAGYIKDDYFTQSYNDTSNTLSNNYASRELINAGLIYTGKTQQHNYSAALNYNETHNSIFSSGDIVDTDRFKHAIFDAQNAWMINNNNTLLFGGEYVHEYTNVQEAGDNNTLDHFGFYAQTETNLANGNLILIPSVRYDDYSSFGGELTYKLSGTWQFINNHRLKANYGTGYKAPTLMQSYGTEATANGTIFGNPDLQPETSDSWELRYETSQNRFNFALGYYQNDLKNYLTTKTIKENSGIRDGEYLRINLGRVELSGVEAELTYDLTDNFYARATYNYIDAINKETGARVAYNAENIYGLDFGYYNDDLQFGMNLWGNWNENYLYGSNEFDYYNFNFSMNKVFNETYSLNLGLYNFIQSERDATNDAALEPMEWRLTLQVNL